MKNKLFIILPALLSLFSVSQVSALKHEYTQIPMYVPMQRTGNSSADSFEYPLKMTWTAENYANIDQPAKQFRFLSRYNSSTQQCELLPTTNYVSPYNQDNSLVWSIGNLWIRNSSLQFSNRQECNFLVPFGDSLDSTLFPNWPSVPEFNSLSISNSSQVSVFIKESLISLLPYSHAYDYIPLNPTGGESQSSGLKMSTLYTDSATSGSINYPDKFIELIVPFGYFDESVGGSLTQGRQLEFTGQFNFPTSSFSFAPNFLSSGTFKLQYYYMNGQSANTTNGLRGNVDCSGQLTYLSNQSVFSFSCPLTIPSSSFTGGSLYVALELRRSSSDDYIWDSGASDWSLTNLYTITDNDSTAGRPFNPECSGSNCDDAPNNPNNDNLPSNDDWFSRLTNLFNFSVINPFAPLYSMFTHGNQCSQIPIIAGMLNASDSTYCPWFPSSVRDVLTPVFSIASMMLLFGFFVRWLGSDAETGVIDNSGTNIKVKGSKK